MQPITPEQALAEAGKDFPPKVIDQWNKAITRNMVGNTSIVMQKEIAQSIANELRCTVNCVYSARWLDVEQMYRNAGWKVEYDRPGWNENYEANFIFRAK